MRYLTKQNAKLGMQVSIPLDGEVGHVGHDDIICNDGEVVLAVRNKATGELLEVRDEMYFLRD